MSFQNIFYAKIVILVEKCVYRMMFFTKKGSYKQKT